MKSSPSIWRYTVKLTVNIVSIFVAFLENMNFTENYLRNLDQKDFFTRERFFYRKLSKKSW